MHFNFKTKGICNVNTLLVREFRWTHPYAGICLQQRSNYSHMLHLTLIVTYAAASKNQTWISRIKSNASTTKTQMLGLKLNMHKKILFTNLTAFMIV